MGFYYFFKSVRGELRYWIRMDGIAGWIGAIAARLVQKVIVDFTLIVQYRHPFEAGGLYWSVNIVLNQIFCVASVYLYKKSLNEIIADNIENGGRMANVTEVGTEKLTLMMCNAADICNSTNVCYDVDFICEETGLEIVLWPFLAGLLTLSFLSFGAFFLSINGEYVNTFYDTRTGPQFAVDTFHEAKTEAMKFEIFDHHQSYFMSASEELRTWLSENWERWEEEKPDWFSAVNISKIPQMRLPEKYLNKLGSSKQERKLSIRRKIQEEEVEGEERARRASEVFPVS